MTQTQALVRQLYRDERGEPIVLTDGQDDIFSTIASRSHDRVHIMCFTRYGKSLTVGLAALTRAATFPEKTAIIAGTKDKAAIIISYINQHIFDNEFTKTAFVPEKGETSEEIRRFRNKNHLTFVTGKSSTGKLLLSEIFIGSAKDALGFGADNVIEDESALIPDNDHSLVMRMLGDNPRENFLCKIGNPFVRNHFLKSYHDPAYKHIVLDCYQGLKEGRITQQIIEENREYSFFKVLYECMFPSDRDVDASGWMQLLSDAEVTAAQNRQNMPSGDRILGVDVARAGRDYNTMTMRTDSTAQLLQKNHEPDLIVTGDLVINTMRENGIRKVRVDDTGVGGGVSDYLSSRGIDVDKVNFGASAEDPDFANQRAEMYAGREGLQHWIKTSGQLLPHKDWIELTKIRHRKQANGKIIMEPKEDMRKRNGESPDVADSLALTFAKTKKSTYHGINPALVLNKRSKFVYDGMPG